MDNAISQIWDEVLTIVKEELTDISYKTWFLNINPLKIIDDSFYILSDNDFERGMLESRYAALITNAVAQVTEKEYTLHILSSEADLPQDEAMPAAPMTNAPEAKAEGAKSQGSMNPKYTFDKFVIGENNRFAHAACVAVSEAPSERYNPLFIYGGVGLGKTHLMQAIGNYILSYAPNKKVVYVSCEKFTNEFIDSIKNKNNIAFRNKYRKVDILLIDDIQFLTGKEGTQEEFFHTFNALHEENKQIVISSDRPPKEIPKLEDRLRSRFEMGLITDISTPNFETRIAILRKKAESYKEEIPNDVLSFIADNIHSNIRELEGALTTVVAYAKLYGESITLPIAKNALKDIFKAKENIVIDSNYIKEMTAKYFNVTVEDMDSKKRTKAIALPRQVAMYLTRNLTDLSLPKIGEDFGGRDHSTVIHACQKITEEMEANTDFKNLIVRIQTEITKDN
ncbi:MAG: chromosomal replication initiator protein DnaA [Eubacterium sp.]|nr:chromosomal replication initiator protein DnaA [Eubacterium sp.]